VEESALYAVSMSTTVRRKQVNKEYLQAKADLCKNLAISQMIEGDGKEAGKNLIRMVNALNQLNLIEHKEEKDNETN
jgi:predicted alpha/beta-hydrolase family hydrolase